MARVKDLKDAMGWEMEPSDELRKVQIKILDREIEKNEKIITKEEKQHD